MPRSCIRPTAIAILLWRDHLLASRHEDESGYFFRPLGGGIEFGERAIDAVHRELREELDREIDVIDLLGVSENIFTHLGEPGHQLMFEFIAAWPEGGEPPDLEPLAGVEANGEPLDAHWLPLAELYEESVTLYPDGLAHRIRDWLRTH